MRSSTKRILSMLAASLLLIGVLIVYNSLIRREMTSVSELRSIVTAKESLFESESRAVSEVQVLVAEADGMDEVRRQVTYALPLSEDVTYALSQVQGLVETEGIALQSYAISPLSFESSKQPIVKRLGTLEVEVAVQGRYEGVKNFMRKLEINNRLANVKSMKISRASQDDMITDAYIATVTFYIYFQES